MRAATILRGSTTLLSAMAVVTALGQTQATSAVSVDTLVNGTGTTFDQSTQGELSASTSQLKGQSSSPTAYGWAEATPGVLRAYAYASMNGANQTGYNMDSAATFTDYFTISGAASASVTLTIAERGSLSGTSGASSYVFMTAQAAAASAPGVNLASDQNYQGFGPNLGGVLGQSSQTFVVKDGVTYVLTMSLEANATCGGLTTDAASLSDFSDAGYVSLRSNTAGVTITTASGYGYTGLSTPEPAAVIPFTAALLFVRRRKARS